MTTYIITINFGNYIGCDNEYIIEAESREEAETLALEQAFDDLEIVDVVEEEDEEDE